MTSSATPRRDVKSLNQVGHYLLYTLSIPERALRSTIGLTAGTAREASDLLVPKAFRDSKTYEIVVRNSLHFLVGKVGGIEQEQVGAATVGDDFVARKAVGNFLDITSLATLHLSPVWILAIVADLAYGTKSYLKELSRELEKKGLIAPDSTINGVEDVLDSVSRSAGQAASLLDTPPLSPTELRRTLEATREQIGTVKLQRLLPQAEIARYWAEMRAAASQSDLGIIDVSGAMTMSAMQRIGAVAAGTLTGIEVAGGIFNDKVLGYYWEALTRIRQKGLFASLRESYAPYVQGVWVNFSGRRDTVTEQLFTGRLPARILRRIVDWFRRRRKPKPEAPPPDPADLR